MITWLAGVVMRTKKDMSFESGLSISAITTRIRQKGIKVAETIDGVAYYAEEDAEEILKQYDSRKTRRKGIPV